MVIFAGVGAADDTTALSVDEATDIAQVVADTFTEYTDVKWVALSPVEVKDDSTDELIGYFYLITNDLEAGVTTIEGLESEVDKAFNIYPLQERLQSRFTIKEEALYDTFCANYYTLIIASEYTEYPIINLEKCKYESNLYTCIRGQWLGNKITDTTPSNYVICQITYVEICDCEFPQKYIKYIVESRLSREQLTVMDAFPGIEYYGSFTDIKDIRECLRSKGLCK